MNQKQKQIAENSSLMDKENKAYEALLQTINTRARNAAAEDRTEYQRQLQLLDQLQHASSDADADVDAHDGHASLLAQLLAAAVPFKEEQGEDEAEAWFNWLTELLLAKKLPLGAQPDPLIDYLLLRIEAAAQRAEMSAPTLRCLWALIKTLPSAAARSCWPRLAAIPLPSSVDAALLLVLCLDTAFSALYVDGGAQLAAEDLTLSAQLANALLLPHYEGQRWLQSSLDSKLAEQLVSLLAHTLQLLQKITAQHAEYAEQHAPELLGFALANLQFGSGHGATEEAGKLQLQLPRRVPPAQQSALYAPEEEEPSSVARSGGRQAKARKMRSLRKQRNNQAAAGGAGTGAGTGTGVGNAGQESKPSNRDQELQLLLGQQDGGFDGSEGFSSEVGGAAVGALDNLLQQRQRRAKVRLSALQLLGALSQQLPRRELYGYWHALFPTQPERATSPLLQLGQTDGNVRCRALALQVAAQLLYGSKAYLNQASSTGPCNYTPFAVSLAESLLTSYRTLSGILEREYAPPVLTQCLKCLAVLVQATPFEQLEMGFVYQFVPQVKQLARHADSSVQVAALLVMEMLVATPRLTQEIACAVGLPKANRCTSKIVNTAPRLDARQQEQQLQQFAELCDSECEEDGEETSQQPRPLQLELQLQSSSQIQIPRSCWLLRYVLRHLDSPASVPPLRVECLQVLLAMASHFALLQDHLERLGTTLCAALANASPDVRLYAARCLDATAYQMSRHVLEQPHQQQHLVFWLRLLPTIYAAYMDEEAAVATTSLKCALCDALSNIGTYCFERLPQAQRNGLLAFLSGCSSDDAEERLVRAAALRALAVYVLHPSLRTDLVFVENTAELALRLTSDTQLNVRTKAAWALGNLSDALVGDGVVGSTERISAELLRRLIAAATLACSDHDKVRSNAVRALGNLLRLLSEPQLVAAESEERSLAQRAIGKLIDCVRSAGSAKVKWNACYAIGSLVRNRALLCSSTSTAATLYPALCQLIVQHANFKVRINAAAVLLQIGQRSDFGQHFAAIWRALLAATERSNALDSYEEYNHRDGLQQQLCLAMAHLLALAKSEDMPGMRATLEPQLDVISATWRRVAYRMVPEQAAPLFTCGPLLQKRLAGSAPSSLATLNSEQRNALTFVVEALRLEN